MKILAIDIGAGTEDVLLYDDTKRSIENCIKMVQNKDAFEEGYFWEYYKDLERQFIDYLNYLEKNVFHGVA